MNMVLLKTAMNFLMQYLGQNTVFGIKIPKEVTVDIGVLMHDLLDGSSMDQLTDDAKLILMGKVDDLIRQYKLG